MSSEEPQCARGRRVCTRGVTVRVWPVQARRAERWATIQSVVPSRCSTVNVVVGAFVDISAVRGVVEVMRW